MTKDTGKLFTEAKGEVELCAEIADYYADRTEEFSKPHPLENVNGDAYYIKQVTDVLVVVEPRNFPFYQIMRVSAPNFMIGDPVILEHAPIYPTSAQAFDDLTSKADVPAGTFKNLFFFRDQAPKAIADPRIVGACLTGSECGGASIATEAGTDLKKSSMESGGNDAFIILEDVDFNLLDKTVLFARLCDAGQVCTSSKHLAVASQENCNKFVDMVVKHFESAKWGNPMDQATTLAPLSSVATKERALNQVKLAKENGVTVVYGDGLIDHPGNFVIPTILVNITKKSPIYNQETFGPVVSIYKIDTGEEAIAPASDPSYGLGGTIFSKDLDHAKGVATRIEIGMLFINSGWASHPGIPFGGIRNSDYSRKLNGLGSDAFVNEHLVSVPDD